MQNIAQVLDLAFIVQLQFIVNLLVMNYSVMLCPEGHDKQIMIEGMVELN